jgi:hypothetical protein
LFEPKHYLCAKQYMNPQMSDSPPCFSQYTCSVDKILSLGQYTKYIMGFKITYWHWYKIKWGIFVKDLIETSHFRGMLCVRSSTKVPHFILILQKKTWLPMTIVDSDLWKLKKSSMKLQV